ncbi:MAG: putative cytosol aminopeptidase [Planctomycetota bacterium]|nr:MAG: putative cytosol aminopeptidase [Planctomycetota bacterium]
MLVALDRRAGGAIAAAHARDDFRGLGGERLLLYPQGLRAPRLLLVGVGEVARVRAELVREAIGAAVQQARALGVERLGFVLVPGVAGRLGEDAPGAARAALEAAALAGYRFEAYRTRREGGERARDPNLPRAFTAVVPPGSDAGAAAQGARPAALERAERAARAVAAGLATARELGNLPSNHGTPAAIAERAVSLAGSLGLGTEVLERDDMERLGMGALLAVARGAANPPKLLVLEHRPAGVAGPPVVLVGKGVTFDTGGISIKPSERLEEMKFDKCGAAAVIGTLEAVARLELALPVVGVAPLVENMPDGAAYRPGDVLWSHAGPSIEVISTDAEGRLVLVDALAWAAERWQPAALVDVATLTGACVIALGDRYAGLFAREPELGAALRRAGEASGEPVWPLPLDPAYDERLKSSCADLKNSGGRPAGACTAARFLARFVPERFAWAHLDIAGVAWRSEEKDHRGAGATGFGVRLLTRWLEERAARR